MISDLIEVGLFCVVFTLLLEDGGMENYGHAQDLLLRRGENGLR
jgi:hypothetical protein